MTITSITTENAKEKFSELVNRVSHNKERIVLTRRGKEVVAIIPIEDLLLLQASESKSDLQEAVEALKEARKEGTISLEELKQKIGELS